MAYWVQGKPFPTVLFEIGCPESQDDLLEDAAQWLIKGDGRIKVVVLVEIQEGCSPSSGTNHMRGLKKEALEQTLAREMSNTPPGADEGDDRDQSSSQPEYAEDIELRMETINWPTSFATLFTVSLETWRYDPRTRSAYSAYQDGPTYNVYPVPDTNPTLSVDMDLIALNEL